MHTVINMHGEATTMLSILKKLSAILKKSIGICQSIGHFWYRYRPNKYMVSVSVKVIVSPYFLVLTYAMLEQSNASQ